MTPEKLIAQKLELIRHIDNDDVDSLRACFSKRETTSDLFSFTLVYATRINKPKTLSYMTDIADRDAAKDALLEIREHIEPAIFMALLNKYDCEQNHSELLQKLVCRGLLATSPDNMREVIRRSNVPAAIAGLLFEGDEDEAEKLAICTNEMILGGNKTLTVKEEIVSEITSGNLEAIQTRMNNGEDLTFDNAMPMLTAIMLGQTEIAIALTDQAKPDTNCLGLAIHLGNDELFDFFLPIFDSTYQPNIKHHPIEEALHACRQDQLTLVVQHIDPTDYLNEYKDTDSEFHQRLTSAVQEVALRQKAHLAETTPKNRGTGL